MFMGQNVKLLCLPGKKFYYSRFYLILVPSEEWKPYSKITVQGIYDAILDSFSQNQHTFEDCLSNQTATFLVGLLNDPNRHFPWTDAPITLQDDFMFLAGLGVFDLEGKINPDFLPFVQKVALSLKKGLPNILNGLATVKGYLDLYGCISVADFQKVLNRSGASPVSREEVLAMIQEPLIAHYYLLDGENIVRTIILQGGIDDFLSAREAFKNLDYAEYPQNDVVSFANRFVFSSHPLKNLILVQYWKFEDRSHFFSLFQDPYGSLLDKEGKEEQEKYDLANLSTPKWILKGHSMMELKVSDDCKGKTLSRVQERTMDPELFDVYKKTVYGFYQTIAKKLHRSVDFESDQMTGEDFAAILKDLHTHFEEDVALYQRSQEGELDFLSLRVLAGLRASFFGRFLINDITEKGLLLLDLENHRSFLIRPLSTPWHDMLSSSLKQSFLDLNIVPFQDYLTYDTFVCPSPCYLDLKNVLNQEEIPLESGRLISTPEQLSAMKA
jgi:hypothetical protein